MPEPLYILILADDPQDAELNQYALSHDGIDCDMHRVQTREDFVRALTEFNPDLILAKYNLTGFDGLGALNELKARKQALPLIFVSAAQGEEKAVEMLHHGASDYIIEGNGERLPAAVRNALANNRRFQALADSEERYRLLTESTLDGIWDWDLERNSLYLSPSWKAQLGFADDELENSFETWIELIHPDDRDETLQKLERFLKQAQGLWDEEFRLQHKQGHYIWINARGSVVKNSAGEIIRILGVHVDIDQQTRAQQLAEKEHLMLNSVFDAVPDLFFLMDQEGLILDYRARQSSELYVPPEGLLGKRMQDLLPSELANRFQLHLDHSINDQCLHTFEYELDMPHGVKQYEARVNTLPGSTQVIAIVRDITKRKTTESQLKERIRQLRCLYDVHKEMQRNLDESEMFRRVNQHLKTALDYPDQCTPSITVDGKNYANEKPCQQGMQKICTPIIVDKIEIGTMQACCHQHAALDLSSEQELLNALADSLSTWLERKRVSQALSNSEARYRLMSRLIPGALYISDTASQRLEYISEGAANLLGIDPQALIEQSGLVQALPVDEDKALTAQLIEQALQSSDSKCQLEYRIRHARSGTIRWISDQSYIERDEQGKARRMFGLMSDVTVRREWEQRLHLYERVVSNTRDLLSVVDRDYIYRVVNDAYCINFGKSRDQLINHPIAEIVGPEVFETIIKPKLDQCFAGQEINYQAWFGIGPSVKYLDVSYSPNRDPQGTIIGAVVSSRDITSLHQAQEKVRQAAQVFSSTIEGVTITDLDGTILDVNPAFTDITGYQRDEVIGKNPRVLQSGRHKSAYYDEMWKSLLDSGSWSGEIWNRRKNGLIYPELLTISAVRDHKGVTTGYVGVFADITSNKENEERLAFLAHHDPLTGLPNRLLFSSRLKQSIKHSRRLRNRLAVLFVDLDRFKNINDSLGHAIGDELLQQMSERLSSMVRTDDTVARISGDEFVMLLENIDSVDHCSFVVHKIMQAFEVPFVLQEHQVRITCSIGISLYPNDGDNSDELLRNADAAMYRAKREGRNSYQYYTREMTTTALEHIFIENALRSALSKQQFELWYQPQVDLPGGKIIGLEALIRWRHPEQGNIPPLMFIPVAEQNGFIRDIGVWVLETACNQAKNWLDQGLDFGRVAVNVSGSQIQQGLFEDQVSAILQATGLPPHCLELEVTESFVMERPEVGIKQLRKLSDLGISIAIDDFGTGYSSLSYLKSMPVEKIKIDQSFVRDIPGDPDDIAISEAIIALARALGMRVIAEGVENQHQIDVLIDKGCREAQGYYFSRPVPASQLQVLLQSGLPLSGTSEDDA